eukprot:CAMPEP_0174269162 /NCGR_PEP_ID=MMETSP0439-20130205/40117_1 /TAXON_ID=0 /ORGANISM="Stereomyxa ramosa, Strain Chinc5" /LENGTH=95 /DNA_ID=CAMNT_0015357785 /DNA_START=73 /DNA_END=361 /DNA_ORIENTATION=-
MTGAVPIFEMMEAIGITHHDFSFPKLGDDFGCFVAISTNTEVLGKVKCRLGGSVDHPISQCDAFAVCAQTPLFFFADIGALVMGSSESTSVRSGL